MRNVQPAAEPATAASRRRVTAVSTCPGEEALTTREKWLESGSEAANCCTISALVDGRCRKLLRKAVILQVYLYYIAYCSTVKCRFLPYGRLYLAETQTFNY